MLFYFLIATSLFLCLIMALRYREMKKHDRILFNFCQIRRDSISMIHERKAELSKKQYAYIRNILDCINAAILNHGERKQMFFNIRKLIDTLVFYRKASIRVNRRHIPDDPEILRLYETYQAAVTHAVCSIPWIRSELLFRLLNMVFTVLFKLGVKPLRGVLNFLDWIDEVKSCQEAV